MTDLPGEPTIRRRTAAADAEPDTEPVDGSTVIARRESRRRANRDGAGAHARSLAPPVHASPGRTAAAPDAASEAVYGARSAAPAVVPRAAPPERTAQAPIDGAAAMVAHRRRALRTAAIVVLAASAVVAGAAASLLAVLFAP